MTPNDWTRLRAEVALSAIQALNAYRHIADSLDKLQEVHEVGDCLEEEKKFLCDLDYWEAQAAEQGTELMEKLRAFGLSPPDVAAPPILQALSPKKGMRFPLSLARALSRDFAWLGLTRVPPELKSALGRFKRQRPDPGDVSALVGACVLHDHEGGLTEWGRLLSLQMDEAVQP